MRSQGARRTRAVPGPQLVAAGVLGLTAFAAGPAAAQALDDRFWIEGSAYFPSADTSVSVSRPGAPGTEADLESDLGLKKHETLPAVFGGARLGKRFMLTGEYYALDRNGSRTLNRDLVFDGATYPASAAVDSKLKSNVYRFTLGYAFLHNETTELGAAVGLHATDFDLRLRGDARVGAGPGLQTESRKRSFLAPLPTIGVFGTYQPNPKLVFNGRVDYLSLKVGDFKGGVTNAQASVAYLVSHGVSVGAAYRYVAYDLDVDKKTYSATIDYNFSGPSVFLRVGFK